MIMTRADKIVITVLAVLSLCGIGASIYLFPVSGQQYAEITVDGKLVKKAALRAGYREEFRVGGADHYNSIEIDGDKIRVREADCPDQVCVASGWIRTAPQQIVCLPWKIVIKVVSAAPAEYDDIAR